jgi:HSP20 family protein
MSIVKHYHRPGLFNNFFDDYNTRDFFSNQEKMNRVQCSVPSVNISEFKEKFELEFAAPGMKKEDFKVELHENRLTVSTTKSNEQKEEGKNYTRREFSYSAFSRSFILPDSVDQTKIEATYTDGILHIALPKKESAMVEKHREISIS